MRIVLLCTWSFFFVDKLTKIQNSLIPHVHIKHLGNVLNFQIPKPNEDCEMCNHENCHTNDLGNKKCPGDPSQGCGNAYRMRLFKWAGKAPSDIEGNVIVYQMDIGTFY